MKDVVLIPAWRRPEFLWHCLANIQRAEGADKLHYLFRFDQGYSPDLHEVVAGFPLSKEVLLTPPCKYIAAKQSYSLLTGYTAAAARTDGLVYMIEEDVMVATDFFRYHQEAHALNRDLFCSIAVANPNRGRDNIHGEPDECYLSSGDYCSLGVAYRVQVIREILQPHMQVAYFTDPVKYCLRNFREAPLGAAYSEQDGLIRRIQLQIGAARPIAYPYQAKAYHAGFYGKNRGAGPTGTWRQRLERITAVIYSDEAMRTFAKHPEWYEDSRPIQLNAQPWTTLSLKPLPENASPVRF
jgi:hypothetical protein